MQCWFQLKIEDLAETDEPGESIYNKSSQSSFSSGAFAVIHSYESLSFPFSLIPHEKKPFSSLCDVESPQN